MLPLVHVCLHRVRLLVSASKRHSRVHSVLTRAAAAPAAQNELRDRAPPQDNARGCCRQCAHKPHTSAFHRVEHAAATRQCVTPHSRRRAPTATDESKIITTRDLEVRVVAVHVRASSACCTHGTRVIGTVSGVSNNGVAHHICSQRATRSIRRTAAENGFLEQPLPPRSRAVVPAIDVLERYCATHSCDINMYMPRSAQS